jgi:hypothetical protein
MTGPAVLATSTELSFTRGSLGVLAEFWQVPNVANSTLKLLGTVSQLERKISKIPIESKGELTGCIPRLRPIRSDMV